MGEFEGEEPLFAASKRGFFPLKKSVMSPAPKVNGNTHFFREATDRMVWDAKCPRLNMP